MGDDTFSLKTDCAIRSQPPPQAGCPLRDPGPLAVLKVRLYLKRKTPAVCRGHLQKLRFEISRTPTVLKTSTSAKRLFETWPVYSADQTELLDDSPEDSTKNVRSVVYPDAGPHNPSPLVTLLLAADDCEVRRRYRPL